MWDILRRLSLLALSSVKTLTTIPFQLQIREWILSGSATAFQQARGHFALLLCPSHSSSKPRTWLILLSQVQNVTFTCPTKQTSLQKLNSLVLDSCHNECLVNNYSFLVLAGDKLLCPLYRGEESNCCQHDKLAEKVTQLCNLLWECLLPSHKCWLQSASTNWCLALLAREWHKKNIRSKGPCSVGHCLDQCLWPNGMSTSNWVPFWDWWGVSAGWNHSGFGSQMHVDCKDTAKW